MLDELVSVIIPVFNVASYLKEAIESIVNQTYTKLDIIIIDDGSVDGSGRICDEYAQRDHRVRVIHQENKGLSSARNVGLDLANGAIISFLDSDDAFCPNMIQKMLEQMEQNKVDIVVCGYSVHTTQERMKPDKHVNTDTQGIVIEKRESFRRILNGIIDTAVWNKLYKKEIWENLRFPDGYVYEGTYIALDIFDRSNRTAVIEDKLVLHRIREFSICNTWSTKNILDWDYARRHLYTFVKSKPQDFVSSKQLNRIISGWIKGLLSCYMCFVYEHPEDLEGRQCIQKILFDRIMEMDIIHCNHFIWIIYQIILHFPYPCGCLYNKYRMVMRYKKL